MLEWIACFAESAKSYCCDLQNKINPLTAMQIQITNFYIENILFVHQNQVNTITWIYNVTIDCHLGYDP